MKKLITILIIHFLLLIPGTRDCICQSITWERTYGHPDPLYEFANSIIQTPDEGYMVAGYDVSYQKALVMRLNKYGDTLWYKTLPYGAPCYKIISTNDGNYIVIMPENVVFKIDVNGNIIWNGGPYNIYASMGNIAQTNDYGYILCGAKSNGPFFSLPHIIKINSGGNFQWEKTYTTNIIDGSFQDVKILPSNEMIFTGSYSDAPDTISAELFIMKTDSYGNQIFFYGYDTLRYHYPKFIYKTISNNFVVGGTTFLININQNGGINWYKRYLNYLNYEYLSITNTNDGGFAITGWFDTVSSGYERLFILKTDSSGNEQWRRIYASNDYYKGKSIKQTSDSGYVVAGYKNNDMYVLKTDVSGLLIGIKPISNKIPTFYNLYQNYPNPFNPITKIKFDIPNNIYAEKTHVRLIIFNVLGQEIAKLADEKLLPGIYEAVFDAGNLPSGIYFYVLEANSFKASKKFVLIK